MINVKTQVGNYVIRCNIIYMDCYSNSNIVGVADNKECYLLGTYEDETVRLKIFQQMIERINSNTSEVFEMPALDEEEKQ